MSAATVIERCERPLAETGMGRLLEAGMLDPLAAAADELVSAVRRHGVLVMRGVRMTEDTFRDFFTRLGSPVRYKSEQASVGYGFGDVLRLDADPDPEKVVTGRGPLPLHTDGVLLKTRVDVVAMYCLKHNGVGSRGATIICDQRAALPALPAALTERLSWHGLEYAARERGYFTTTPEADWFAIEAFRREPSGASLNIALPFAPSAPASWEVRVPGATAAESDRFLAELDAFLGLPRFTYAHAWRQGDLMLFDNRTTLHGRQEVDAAAVREILRGQVTVP